MIPVPFDFSSMLMTLAEPAIVMLGVAPDAFANGNS
jgi:hypothetical protein